VHSYLITAKPGRLVRACVWLRTWTVRFLALLVMVLLGAAVFTIRCARPVINYLATRAMWLELWAARVTGIGPMGAAVGAGLTEEFVREFHRGFARPTANTH
jgi:hypothetical protein